MYSVKNTSVVSNYRINQDDFWFESELYNMIKEEATINDCFTPDNPLKKYLKGFIELKYIKENYMKYIKLCDFLLVTNVDIIIDLIVKTFGVSIILSLEDFYKTNSQRLKPHTNRSLKDAITLWCKDKNSCFMKYGHCSYWDISKVDCMQDLFLYSTFNEDISKWDVSSVTDMSFMFYNSQFNKDISMWNTSNVTNMNSMFTGSIFNGDISNWNVSNVWNILNIFIDSKFTGNISKWDISNVKIRNMLMSRYGIPDLIEG